VGVSPSHYHINLRMDEAKRLLRETKRSVVEIALEVGYANPSHFAQLFRKETGLSRAITRPAEVTLLTFEQSHGSAANLPD